MFLMSPARKRQGGAGYGARRSRGEGAGLSPPPSSSIAPAWRQPRQHAGEVNGERVGLFSLSERPKDASATPQRAGHLDIEHERVSKL